MPIYEYECNKCSGRFEVLQSISEEPLTDCTKEKCKGVIHKVPSLFSGRVPPRGAQELRARAEKLAKQDLKEMRSGKQSKIDDIYGTKENQLKTNSAASSATVLPDPSTVIKDETKVTNKKDKKKKEVKVQPEIKAKPKKGAFKRV